ncbi:MAG: glycosyltransferase family 2 protein [Acidobacteria bacterium]|nr:glycosyltransferase family 2 protein [Acidobacteriota bacterium]
MTAPGLPAAPEVTAVVPTVGRSPWLGACLQALRRQEGMHSLEIVVVDQSPQPLALPAGLADRVLRPERNLGFAGGTNLGLAAAGGELLATVNDDAMVAPGWLAALAAALRADPRAAAAQGVNLIADALDADPGDAWPSAARRERRPDGDGPAPGRRENETSEERPGRIDGCGLGWNRWWQAIQLGHGEPAPPPPGGYATPIEVFGVSATAALFRRTALEQVALGGGGGGGQFFDPRLISYYEDAELAGRLQAAGFSALLVPAARAHHAGSSSGRTAPASRDRWRLIYGNRYLAAARLLGRGLWPRLPLMLLRDLLDLAGPAAFRGRQRAGAAVAGQGPRLADIAAGWARALRHLPVFARRGAPVAAMADIARLSRWPAQPR